MNGVGIVGALLLADPAVLAISPADRIKAGKLPDGIALTALLVRSVSLVDRQPLRRSTLVRSTERVSVTVRAGNYDDQVAAIRAVRRCCAGWLGNMAAAWRISVLTAGLGPDVIGPGNSFEQTQDFKVSFDA